MFEKKVWFIADIALGHEKLIIPDHQGKHRPFKSVEEMNDTIINNINNFVGPLDKLYLLGNVLYSPSKNHNLLGKITANKTLLLGGRDEIRHSTEYYLDYFKNIVLHKWFTKENFICSHQPMLLSLLKNVRYNVHGYTRNFDLENKRYINVSADAIKFKPISLYDIKEEIKHRDTEYAKYRSS